MNQMAPPDVKTIPLDNDRDGMVDQYNVSLRFKKPKALIDNSDGQKVSPLKMQQVNVILAFNYQL